MGGEAIFPDGLGTANISDGGVFRRHSGSFVGILLMLLLGAAIAGVFAGKPNPTAALQTTAATLEVNAPTRIRSGQIFEVRMVATAKADITDLVIAVPPSLWRDWTVNTMIPGPADESFRDGRFEFHFGELKAGERFSVKIDAQLNPALFGVTRGTIVLLDGEKKLGGLPLATRILP